jgi:FlaG/FlaF family flagellin (archaellin)
VSGSRAISSAIAAILLVAILIVLAATISGAFLGVGSELREPSPNVAQSSGEFIEQEGFSGGIVRITHLAGDTVPVADLEVAIDVTDACGRTARILNLPADANRFGFDGFDDSNLREGDDSIVSKGTFNSEWDAGVLHTPSNSVLVEKDLTA